MPFGGAIHTLPGDGVVNVVGCHFTKNEAMRGGAIFSRNYMLNVIDSKFVMNSASDFVSFLLPLFLVVKKRKKPSSGLLPSFSFVSQNMYIYIYISLHGGRIGYCYFRRLWFTYIDSIVSLRIKQIENFFIFLRICRGSSAW